MRLRVGRQRTEDRGLVGVDVGQRGHRGPRTGGSRATAGRTHGADGTGWPGTVTARLAGVSTPVPPTGRRPTPGAARRDRRGRGMRGPGLLPGPAGPRGVPAATQPQGGLRRASWWPWSRSWRAAGHAELGLVEFAVEETPMVPDDWDADTVPLASLVRGVRGRRRPGWCCSAGRSSCAPRPAATFRDGADRARRAGLRAARARRPRRSTPATTPTTTDPAQRSPGRTAGRSHPERQRRQRHRGEPAAGVARPRRAPARSRPGGVTTT